MTKIIHKRQEILSWMQILDYIQQETIHLKNQLAGIIKHDIESSLLEKAEYFQNEFLNIDTVIALLRHDLIKHSNIAEAGQGNDIVIIKKHDKLRLEIEIIERKFGYLKSEFIKYQGKTG